MFYHNLEDFSQRLILGEHHFITSTSIFKRAMLTGYLSILVICICLFYFLFDMYIGMYNAILYYLTLINFAIISFFLNRSGKYEYAKILLLAATLLIIALFCFTEPVNNGNYFNFFPITVAAFALYDYKEVHKGTIFTIISIGLFLATYFYNMPTQEAFETSATTNFPLQYLISLSATVLVIVFLIKLNKTIEHSLIAKDRNLIRTTRKLKASQQRFELAISGSNAGIYDWDIKNNLIYHSPMWKKLLGYNANELERFSIENFYELIHPEDVNRAKLNLQNHLLNGSKYSEEIRLRTKGGEYHWFCDSGQAVWNKAGKPVRMVGSIIKIHERKIAEERIKKQNRMLEKTNLELDNFVYSASHDIRSPLTSILGLINIALKTNDKREIEDCLNLMKTRIHRLDEFIEDILDFSRNIRLGKKLREINLYYFIDEILKEHDFGDQFDKLDVRVSLSSDFEVISDPLRLKVILKNLLSNASKFSNLRNESPWLRISALRVDGNFQLIVEDNGQGIRKELQGKIFDMFYRASEKSKGSGLGLYIVNEMVQKLNGNIKVNSVYGEGSQFIIELPDHKYAQKVDEVSAANTRTT
ncbi:MAG: PAS domain-containing sensor histidine kinase [Cytophagales bacterium]|nr:PAS domain-containing sensor histidine kinase [Cytophagales bacterium]